MAKGPSRGVHTGSNSVKQTADPVSRKRQADRQDAIPLHLLRLVSPSLPIGAFSYSRGLEAAVHAGWVRSEAAARDWILGCLENVFTAVDGALFWRMIQALYADEHEGFAHANAWLAASRESREMQLEDQRMGAALISLLKELDVPAAHSHARAGLTYPASFAIAAHHWNIAPLAALTGLMWTVVEAQVAAAIRLIPLGHVSGQRILVEAVPVVQRCTARAATLKDPEIGNLSVATAMASAWHETQYSRLFRS
ncbi:urease accessory protein UreF [Rhizobium mesoamericanum]|uniref:urease accessory protein UreF n=1 Tax=Rhizobium mesoamericanum TaxID=1079800 RepID=UPI0027D89542|nr:urease accessory UreF family protein [Rhizobium mesoamericanum]